MTRCSALLPPRSIDFDWEYPAVSDRGGQASDTAGFTALVAELRGASRAAGRPSFLITMAAGAGSYGYSGLDLPRLHPNLDFINLMTYDYHGKWEKSVNYHTPWTDARVGAGGPGQGCSTVSLGRKGVEADRAADPSATPAHMEKGLPKL